MEAPWFDEPAELQDLVEICPDGRFLLKGRHTDMIEVAGKRASLAELPRRILAIPGVRDAIVFQPDEVPGAGLVGRVSALVVAPDLSEADVIGALRNCIDAAFLPRPLVMVAELPRSSTGKLPRRTAGGAPMSQLFCRHSISSCKSARHMSASSSSGGMSVGSCSRSKAAISVLDSASRR